METKSKQQGRRVSAEQLVKETLGQDFFQRMARALRHISRHGPITGLYLRR